MIFCERLTQYGRNKRCEAGGFTASGTRLIGCSYAHGVSPLIDVSGRVFLRLRERSAYTSRVKWVSVHYLSAL